MITNKSFQKLQKLAKLDFSTDEVPFITEKLNKVISMIDQVSDLKCDHMAPLRSVCDMEQRLRADEVTASNIADQLFSNVTDIKGAEFAKSVQCFTVPKVVE